MAAGKAGEPPAPGASAVARPLSRGGAAESAPPTPGGVPAAARPVVTRRYAALGSAPCASGRGPSSVPGIVSPSKITVKGAPAARRLLRNRRPLSSDLARQVLGTYRKDGAERERPESGNPTARRVS